MCRVSDGRGEMSKPSNTFQFETAPETRLVALKQQFNGFFDAFDDIPYNKFRAPDARKWTRAFSFSNGPLGRYEFTNGQQHEHTLVYIGDGGPGDRAVTASRALTPIDFSDNGTRKVVISLDTNSMSGRTVSYLGFVPEKYDIDHEGFDSQGGQVGYPEGGFRIEFSNFGTKIETVDPVSGQVTVIAEADWRWMRIGPTTNDQRHVMIEISPTKMKMKMNGVPLLETPVNSFKLNYQKYNVIWSMLGYNPSKDGRTKSPCQTHWNNFGFDAPANAPQYPAVHSYFERNDGATNIYSRK